ncbi:MAG: ABC transporter substrate-binding protein [Chloroflexota bacterium]
MSDRISRRGFMRWIGATSTGLFAIACSAPAPAQPTVAPKAAAPTTAPAPAAAPTQAPAVAAPAPAAKDSMAAWDELVAAATKEGKVVVNTFPGAGYRQALTAFEEKYPGIKVEHSTLIARELAVKSIQEQKAGVYSFDVTEIPATTALSVMLPEGVWAPIAPAMIHPEVTGDQYWVGGFKRGFADASGQYGYNFGWNKYGGPYINTDVVKPGEIKSGRDVLDPKWKGKLVLMDPRSGGFTANWVTSVRKQEGDEYLKKLLIDQEPVITRDQRQATEMLIRGGFALGTGPDDALLDDFRKSGVTVNVTDQPLSDANYIQGRTVWLFKNAPNPNAAKLFINWILSKDGQETYSRVALNQNSRRTDVAPIIPEDYPTAEEARTLIFFDTEEWVKEVEITQKLATELMK